MLACALILGLLSPLSSLADISPGAFYSNFPQQVPPPVPDSTNADSNLKPPLSDAVKTQAKTQEKSDTDLSPVSVTENDDGEAKFEGDKVDYDPDTGAFTIEGAANLYLPKQGIKLAADRIEYSPKDSLLKAMGNVLISGRDQVTFAKYLEINLDTNNAQLDGEVKSQVATAGVEAQKASLLSTKASRIGTYRNGFFDLNQPIRLGSQSGNAQSFRLVENRVTEAGKLLADGQSFTMQANKLVYYPDRIQNNLYVTGASLKFKKVPITLPLPFGVFTAGESTQQMFGLVMGNSPRTGAGDFNLGPKVSLVLGDPEKRRAIHAAPFLQFGSSAGYGGMLQYTDPRNSALIAYGAAKDRGLAEVTSRLTRYNNFVYGWNSYLAGGITKQFVQLNDRRTFKLPILGSLFEGDSVSLWSDLTFATDSQELRNEENNLLSRLQRDSLGFRARDKSAFRLQHNLSFSTKPILEIGTERYNAGIRLNSTNTARFYSTGNINAFTSIGPSLRIHAHRYADLDFGYNQMFPVGQSPFGFDQVIQGQRSAFANGDINLTRWLTIGGYGVYSFTRQNWVAQQARIVIGPEDFKLMIGYDPVRRQLNFGFNLLFNDKVGFREFSYRKNNSGKKRRF